MNRPTPARAEWLRIAAIAVVQGAALLWLSTQLGTSRDEEYALATTARGPAYAFGRALTFELQAPLYFVLCALWRELDASMLFARSFSILVTVACTPVVAVIAKRLRPEISASVMTLAYVLNPMTIYAAVDIRSYALSLLFGALATLAFLDGWWAGRRGAARVAFVIFGILGVYTHYYAAFAVASLAAGLLVAGRIRALPSYLGCAGLVAVALLAAVRLVSSQLNAYDFTPEPALTALHDTFLPPLDLLALPGQSFSRRGWAYIIVFGIVVLAFAYGRTNLRAAAVRLWLGTLAGLYAIYCSCAVFLHVNFSAPRHYFVFVIPLLAGAAAALGATRSSRRVAVGRAVASIYLITATLAAYSQYRSLAKYGDWKHVAAFVATHARAADRVAIFEADAVPAFERYYDGAGPVLAFPHSVDPNRYVASALAVGSKAEAREALRRLMTGTNHAWLAIDCEYRDRYPHEGCDQVQQAVDELYPHRGRTDFFKAWVAELPAPRSAAATQTQP